MFVWVFRLLLLFWGSLVWLELNSNFEADLDLDLDLDLGQRKQVPEQLQ